MTREEEIKQAAYAQYCNSESICFTLLCNSFKQGAEWADNHPKSLWVKFTGELPPLQEPIIIAVKNKNKEDGIWLYDLCMFFGGDYTDNNNWEGKVNWEIPIYWMPIPKLPKE